MTVPYSTVVLERRSGYMEREHSSLLQRYFITFRRGGVPSPPDKNTCYTTGGDGTPPYGNKY